MKIGKDRQKRDGSRRGAAEDRESSAKAGQVTKDYVAIPGADPLFRARRTRSTLKANVTANVIRNVWTNAVISAGTSPTA